jgi:Penicillin-insensitive murein endopeptidase
MIAPALRTVLAAALAAAPAVALGACGGGPPVEQVRVLRMTPGVLSTQRPHSPTTVRAALTRPGAPQLPPATAVPQVGSVAVGATNAGRLVNGLQLPEAGPDWATYDPILHRAPNRPERRWATDRLLAFVLYVLRDYRLANPGAPPVVIGDLSRPHGGPFGRRYGGLGHASHQNGLDADVYYPRVDRALRAPSRVAEVDRGLAQDLVSRFVAAGAQYAFVGEHVGLDGAQPVVQAIPHHDDHVHVRIANWRR